MCSSHQPHHTAHIPSAGVALLVARDPGYMSREIESLDRVKFQYLHETNECSSLYHVTCDTTVTQLEL